MFLEDKATEQGNGFGLHYNKPTNIYGLDPWPFIWPVKQHIGRYSKEAAEEFAGVMEFPKMVKINDCFIPPAPQPNGIGPHTPNRVMNRWLQEESQNGSSYHMLQLIIC